MTTIKPQTSSAVAIRQATRILGTDEAGVAELVKARRLTEMYTRPTSGEPEAIYNVTELETLAKLQKASVDPARVDRALRHVIALLDYDLHKELERDEGDGQGGYYKQVDLFLAAYEKGAPKAT
jgi:hypothetical protein